MEAKMDEVLNSLASLTDSHQKLATKLDEQHASLMKEIDKKIKACVTETNKVNERVDHLDMKVDDLMEQSKRNCNLIVNGIPFKENEDISTIFATISSKLGYQSPPESTVFRCKGADNNKRIIIIKFPTDYHKQQFFNRYVKVATTLTLDGLKGFVDNNARYYIQHDLSKQQYEVNKLAQRLRKEQMVKQVKVIQGYVALKFSSDSPFLYFPSASHLAAKVKDIAERESSKDLKSANSKSDPKEVLLKKK